MSETGRATPQNVWLVAVTDEAERELEIRFAPDATVAELIDQMRAQLGAGPATQWFAYSHRLGRDLVPSDLISRSGIVAGDRIELLAQAPRDPTEAGPEGPLDLVVVGGPLLGTRHRLEPGEHIVGRGSGSDVKIDDPAMSRRHLRVVVDGDGVVVSDAGSTNGTFVDGERVSNPRSLGPKDVVEAGGSLIAFEPALSQTGPATHTGTTIPFNRPPRVQPAQRDLDIEVPVPPEEPTGPRIPLAMAVVPLLVGIVMVMLFPENKAMLLFFAMTPVIAVWSFVEERRSGRKTFRSRRDEYGAEVAALETHLASFVAEEIDVRRHAFPDAAEVATWARDLSPRLWERRRVDPDFVAVRIGFGDEPSMVRMKDPSSGSRALREETAQRLARYTTIRAVPIIVDLRSAGTTGVCGAPDDVPALVRWMILQIATLQSPDDVEFAGVFPGGSEPAWAWMKWLPHVGAAQGTRRLSFGGDGLAVVEALTARAAAESEPGSHTIAVIDGDVEIPRSALSRLLDATGSNLSVVWLGRDPRTLPGQCRAVVEADAAHDLLRVTYPAVGQMFDHTGAEGITVDHALETARALAPIRDTSVGPTGRAIPPRVELWDALEIPDPSAGEVASRWQQRGGDRVVPLGIGTDGVFAVDLRADGPHALIGGTTGAGKSELLQTLITGLALRYPPERVNLLLIDYKGGTAFKDLETLPHVVGSVTDLDGHLARRALVSLDAELKRREIHLREQNARDVLELEKRDRAPLPDLVLVIDEFAALVAELPDFVEGIVDIAQRGRALGIHLVLATQKPAGVVSDKIRANTNLRIALRMSDEADSFDVIGLPDAAHIPRTLPGRAFARTGHAEISEFQSAFAGAPAVIASSDRVVVRELDAEGSPAAATTSNTDGSTTQLAAIVGSIADAGAASEVFRPVLPALPEVLPLSALGSPSAGRRFPIGLLDEPTAQRQVPYELDLAADGSAIVYGTGGSGKTTLLRTIAASIATHGDPDDVNVYALDLGTRGLAALETLPHCGSVVFAEEDERIRRLMTMLKEEIAARRNDPGTARPDIVVLLDGYAAFASAFERVDYGELLDLLPRLVADGRQVGVNFVITADRRGAIPSSLTGIIPTRFVMRLADTDEYAALGIPPTDQEALTSRGRASIAPGVMVQVAVSGEGSGATEQVEALESLGARIAAPKSAPEVRVLPPDVPLQSLDTVSEGVPFALDDRWQTVSADLSTRHLLIAGPRRSGRSTSLATIARMITSGATAPPLHLIAGRNAELSDIQWTTVAEGPERFQEWMASEGAALLDGGRAIVFIDDGDEIFDTFGADELERLVKQGRDRDVRVVAAVESHAVHRAFGGWIAELRKERHGVLLQPDVEIDGDLFGVRLPRRKIALVPGRGYFVDRGDARLIQVAK